MVTIDTRDRRAVDAVAAIHAGRTEELRQLLRTHPELATSRIGDDDPDGMSRTLLHVATDWPGHFPDVADSITTLIDAGAEVDARFRGPHLETALHWAASSDDVDAITALLDGGADIDARGGVIAGGTPLGDATAFAQWAAARALIARGATAGLFDLAALGMIAEIVANLEAEPETSIDEINHAFWSACHGGQLETARLLSDRGADIDWVPGWERMTPLDTAAREGAHDVVRWLHGLSAHTCAELDNC
ncbi:ankyrin repeat domain-containing protein [Naasia lichenicola]|uniref:Ankyrin repeat domain-containing protein n=1 Tax=Naasia lichenicola TaxID=2565933 RepID=A0A4V3WTA2_9MICO|nr:ankyrin repeat domain-containing protein [Naasia lichenicola]